jgi:hypothetical protein
MQHLVPLGGRLVRRERVDIYDRPADHRTERQPRLTGTPLPVRRPALQKLPRPSHGR